MKYLSVSPSLSHFGILPKIISQLFFNALRGIHVTEGWKKEKMQYKAGWMLKILMDFDGVGSYLEFLLTFWQISGLKEECFEVRMQIKDYFLLFLGCEKKNRDSGWRKSGTDSIFDIFCFKLKLKDLLIKGFNLERIGHIYRWSILRK